MQSLPNYRQGYVLNNWLLAPAVYTWLQLKCTYALDRYCKAGIIIVHFQSYNQEWQNGTVYATGKE